MGTCFMKAFETKAWEGVLCSEGLTFKWDGNGEPPPPPPAGPNTQIW